MKTHLTRRGPALSRAAAVLLTVTFTFACGAATQSSLPPTSASSPGATAQPTDPATPAPSDTATLPPATPESATPTPLADIAQAPVTYSPPPPPTPWPSIPVGDWRWQGVVVDGTGAPVEGVCIAVGPHGCQPSSPRTDARGAWFIDFPQAPVSFDLHFAKDGFATYDVRVTPTSDWTLNVTLAKG